MATTIYAPRISMASASDLAYEAAAAAQDAILTFHSWDLDLAVARTCKCGRTFGTQNGLGLHRGAVERQADKAWDDAYEATLARLGY